MVALVKPTAFDTSPDVTAHGGSGHPGKHSVVPAHRSHLRLVESPPQQPRTRGVPVAGVVVAVAVVFGLLLAIRLVQSPPSSASWAELSGPRESAEAFAGPGDQIRVAVAGDTFWALARELAPGEDPRPVVDRLVAANGGSPIIEIGQRLVIPADVLKS